MADKSSAEKTIQAVFSPAITMLNRMGYTGKFTLLWLMSLAAIAIVAYGLFASLDQVIQPSYRQLQGLALIEPIPGTVQILQQHRGISAALLGGNEAMQERRAAKERETEAAFRVMEGVLPAGLTSNEDFRRIKADWEHLRKDGLHWTVAENFAAHTRLIEQMLLFEVLVADEYLLTLDTELASSYLIDTAIIKLPHVLEHLGQIRAYGTGILARKQITESQKVELKVMMGELGSTLKFLNLNLEKSGRYNPAVQKLLLAVHDDIADSAQQITGIATSDILTGHFATRPDIFLDMATVAIDRGYTQIHQTLLPTTRALIGERIAKAEKTLLVSIGSALLLLLVVVYISVSIYYAIIGIIRLLVHYAHTFAEGDLNVRVRIDTHDEFSQLGDSFNRMADGFNILLEERKRADDLLRSVVENAPVRIFWKDRNLRYLGCNTHFAKDAGYSSPADVIGKTDFEMGWKNQAELYRTDDKAVMESGIPKLDYEEPQTAPDGNAVWLRTSKVPLRDESNQVIGILGIYEDITGRKKSEELIWKQANFDALTGLPNRHMFYDRLEQDIKKAHRAGLKMVLLFIDLDKFKEVNDTLGHGIGDLLLVEAARRISDCVRETDTVARLGGDEFTVILSELDDIGIVERVAGDILRKLAEPFRLGNEVAYVSASIGITLYPDDATEVENLLKNADQAMYTAKDKGRNRFSYFTHSMQQAAQTRLRLISELRRALAANQFRLYYQPVVELATGRINKMEALIRWQHPERGMVSPAQFIPLAEETGLIIEIGDWVFKEAARQLKQWKTLCDTGFQSSINVSFVQCAELQISVNVSPVQFHNISPYKTWSAFLRELGLPEQSMVIEITEGLLLEADADVTGKLLEFRDVGIQVAIDDFGTGYSSLAYLKKFDIDYLKIDQSFVRNLTADSNDLALSEAIIVMAHKLGLKVIAEGVETGEQCKLLSAAGCDYAQGYLFSRPVPAGEFEELLRGSRLLSYKCCG